MSRPLTRLHQVPQLWLAALAYPGDISISQNSSQTVCATESGHRTSTPLYQMHTGNPKDIAHVYLCKCIHCVDVDLPAGSLSPGALAAAIAVPVAAALLLALAAFCCFRRIRRRRAAARSGADVKDVETGRMSVELRRDVKRISRDQGPSDDSRDKVGLCSAHLMATGACLPSPTHLCFRCSVRFGKQRQGGIFPCV